MRAKRPCSWIFPIHFPCSKQIPNRVEVFELNRERFLLLLLGVAALVLWRSDWLNRSRESVDVAAAEVATTGESSHGIYEPEIGSSSNVEPSTISRPVEDPIRSGEAFRGLHWSGLLQLLPATIEISDNQRQMFLATTRDFERRRESLEKAHLARLADSADAQLVLRVYPYYSEGGQAMADEFYAKMIEIFGEEKFAQIDPVIGPGLDMGFRYWGLYDQRYFINRNYSEMKGIYYSVDLMTVVQNDEQLPGWESSNGKFEGSYIPSRVTPDRFVALGHGTIEEAVKAFGGFGDFPGP